MEAHPPVDQADHLEILVNTARNFLFLQKLDSAKMFIDRAEPIAMEIRENSLFYDFIAVKSNQLNESREFLAAKELLLPAIEAAKGRMLLIRIPIKSMLFTSNCTKLISAAINLISQKRPSTKGCNTNPTNLRLIQLYDIPNWRRFMKNFMIILLHIAMPSSLSRSGTRSITRIPGGKSMPWKKDCNFPRKKGRSTSSSLIMSRSA